MLRRLSYRDLPAVLRVASSAFIEEARRPEVIGPGFLDALSRKPELQIGAFEEGKLVGFLIGDEGEDWALVNWIAVSPTYQHRGVGSLLLTEYEQAVKKRGKSRVRLGTPFSKGFYENMGYTCVNVERVLWKKIVGQEGEPRGEFSADLAKLLNLLEDFELDSVRCAFNPGCIIVGKEELGVALAMENRWSRDQVDVVFSKYQTPEAHFTLLSEVEARARERGAYSLTERFEETELDLAKKLGWSDENHALCWSTYYMEKTLRSALHYH
ncbi:MAG: GNAT family N-acetyltransferase [Thermoprotei archaeon]